ncbi:MFS transporter [Chthoniobacter flavus]|uniref:MFS transporter n=1 Tax=Chthoniobacter flavus TaxID=191863 RepID=UPI0012FAF257|nr:MFS transporter [Chthoniobacter flavus]
MNEPSSSTAPSPWGNVVLAAILMLATLPGRTQGLGLITEYLLRDFGLDHVGIADINLWATLIGSLFCLPAGWFIDRCGLRTTALGILLPLAAVVFVLSMSHSSVALLFALVLLSRGLGQSALSVTSITAVGKTVGRGEGWAMGVYSALFSVLYALAFIAIGWATDTHSWRFAWFYVAVSLLLVALLTRFYLREPAQPAEKSPPGNGTAPTIGLTLGEALRTPVFWIFGGATALFALVYAGIGLFNQAIFAEHGFDATTYHHFAAVSALWALTGQMLCGWLSLHKPMPRLLAAALLLLGLGLAALPQLQNRTELWIFAGAFGLAVGFVTVIFFAVWGRAFGQAHLGRIQGAAQMVTVFASAVGPLLFAEVQKAAGSFTPALYALSVIVCLTALAAWCTRLPGQSI